MTIYVWGMPAEYPSAYIGDYRLPGNPDRFQFLKGESVPTTAVVPTIRFNAPLKLLQRYACLPSNAMAPIVSAELRRFLEASAAACLQFFPVNIATTTDASDDYSLLNAIQKVHAIDFDRSRPIYIRGTKEILRFDRLEYLPDNLVKLQIARDADYLSHLLVSEPLTLELRAQGFGGVELALLAELT